MFRPDPASLLWDAAAARFLDRVQAARPGRWTAMVVADPTPRTRARLPAMIGTRWDAPDPQPGRKARTRWVRAFARALERERKRRGMTVEWQAGRRVRAVLSGLPRDGRAFRARVRAGGGSAMSAVQGKPLARRIWDDQGQPAGRWADPDGRDWPQ